MIVSSSKGPSTASLIALGAILFVSGFCSLAFQVVWLREFRLLFGGATPAASAVLAVFMGGLGIGGAYLGAKVERSRNPGRFYAVLEAGITIAAILSPFLLMLVQSLYIRTGGIESLGLTFATLLQIGMTAIVIGPACFLMGGTLPAALKYAQTDQDPHRSTTAFYYGLNVCGAVSGAFLANFVMLPSGGNNLTLFTAGFANAIIAALSWALLRRTDDSGASTDAAQETKDAGTACGETAPAWFVYAAAFTSGFVFFLIELVWYRASIPLFGGSVYNFGLILAVVLAGIGCGSLLYSLFLRKFRPTLTGFSIVSCLLAFFIILPFMLGDHLAHFALLLNNFFQPRSFEGLIFGWTMICGILVFLPALFSGIQFPLLISLLGRGNSGIGSQIGRTYGWNTLGAVTGSLLGGFILIPALSIPTCWRVAAAAAVLLSAGSLLLHFTRRGKRSVWTPALTSAACAGLVFLVLTTAGPSSYWFHHPIGYGRADALYGYTAADWKDYVRKVNRAVVSKTDGRESSISLMSYQEYAVFTNGKSDSAAISDAPTTVMIGLVGTALHPSAARDVCVVGLATGITVGWLGEVDEVRSVDVVEMEKGMIDMSHHFKAVNFDAINHPKTNFIHGDAREYFTSTSEKKYDLIVSEPSNLHRAGVANLYTREFYESVAGRMNADAVFCQWLQTYDTDWESMVLVVATLRSVFPKVELWQTLGGDLLLVCALDKRPWDFQRTAARLGMKPYDTALRNIWQTTSPEGFFAHNIGNPDFSDRLAKTAANLNTDDHNLIEFAFGRSVGDKLNVMNELIREAHDNNEATPWIAAKAGTFRPDVWATEVLWKSINNRHQAFLPAHPEGGTWAPEVLEQHAYLEGRARKSPVELLKSFPGAARTAVAALKRAEVMAQAGHEGYPQAVAAVRDKWPVESALYDGMFAEARRQPKEAVVCYLKALELLHVKPWVVGTTSSKIMNNMLRLMRSHAAASGNPQEAWFESVSRPLPYSALWDQQREMMMTLSKSLPAAHKVRAIESWGPHFPWKEGDLRFRAEVYEETGHPDAGTAKRELEAFLAGGR